MEQRRTYEKNGKKMAFVFNGIVIFCLILLILEMRWQAKKEESEVLNVKKVFRKKVRSILFQRKKRRRYIC